MARSHFRSSINGGRLNIPLVHDDCGFADVLSIDECGLRDGSHPASSRLVHIVNVGIVRVVVDVCDGDVIDGRVTDVDALDILAAGAIRGHIHFSWTKRKPTYVSASTAN